VPNITIDALRRLAPHGGANILKGIVGPLNTYLPAYGIDTVRRLPHFLAQTAEESAGFKTLTEYASGKEYEGRHDLGNTHPGDGIRFKGRGLIQCTGRANYKTYGDRLGIDLVGHPEKAAEPEVSVRLACEYWKDHKLNALADADDIEHITRRINGGVNGLAERKRYLAIAKNLFADDADEGPKAADPAPVPLPRRRPEAADDAPDLPPRQPDDPGPDAEPDDTKPHQAPADAPKTGISEGAKVGTGLGVAGIFSQVWEQVTQAPDAILQAVLGAAGKPAFWVFVGVIGAGAFIWYRRAVMKKAA